VTQSGLSRYDLKVRDGWKADFVESVVTATLSEPFSIFAEHGPEMGTFFGDVPLTNHFEAEVPIVDAFGVMRFHCVRDR
jgi:hypothetical protein